MSEMQLNPTNYINKLFGEACQEIGQQPQEVVGLLLFQFLQITPEDRGTLMAELKKDFNSFTAVADFDAVIKNINEHIDEAELNLYDWLAQVWVDSEEE